MSDRNFILCFDGTNNEFGPENTNIVRLVQVLNRDSSKQRLYYDPGVGTLPEPGVLLPAAKTITRWLGLGFGLGLTRKICDAYAYLMEYWEPEDKVFIFGFSRGAYAARVLAGLLHAVGLLPRGGSNLIPYAFRYFRRLSDDFKSASSADSISQWKQFCDDFRSTFGRATGNTPRRFQVHFLGVWDTVSSVGWVWDPKHFPYTASNPSVQHIRHAVSIDERRAFFRQNLFHPVPGQDLLELWFPGVHCDVGGGYRAEFGRLWWDSFAWMLGEATNAGLQVDDNARRTVLANPPTEPWAEQINQSLTWKWYISEAWPKFRYQRFLPGPNFGRRRSIRSGSRVYRTALQRIRDAKLNYAPDNLPTEFYESVRGLATVPEFLEVP